MNRPRLDTRPRISGPTVAIASIGLLIADIASQLAGDSLLPGRPSDEIAHLLTTLIVVWALGPRVSERLLVPALIASVAIDLDHVPGRFGVDFLTAGAPRPYTHSLLTIAVVLIVAACWRRRRDYVLDG